MFSIALLQMPVATAKPEANLARAEPMLAEAAVARTADEPLLAVLPEMWTTGFRWSRLAELAQRHAAIVERLGELARRHGLWIHGSMPLPAEDPQRPANTAVLIAPDGRVAARYRKVHLFTLFDEQLHLTAGQERVTHDAPWGRTGLGVCYDLRFPELFRAYALDGVVVQLLPSAWPHPRLEHWRTLVRARAIENQMFVVAVNQVGTEHFENGGEATYCGHSAVVDPWGERLVEAGEDQAVVTARIDPSKAIGVREKMTVLRDRRPGVY